MNRSNRTLGQRIIPIVEETIADAGGQAQPPVIDEGRRQALKWMAVTLAMASGACSKPPTEPIHAYGSMAQQALGDGGRYYATAFVREGFAHGVLVRTEDGRPIKVEGLAGHPASLGATDIYAQASVLDLWHPERSKTVMRRVMPPHRRSDDSESRMEAPPLATSSWSEFEAAWVPLRASLRSRDGSGLYVVTGAFSSPTLKAQIASLLRDMPRARWIGCDEGGMRTSDDLASTELAFGEALQTVRHWSRAKTVVCLGADPLHGGPDSVRHAMDWAATRGLPVAARPLLFVAESTPGLTGAKADARIAKSGADIEAMLWRWTHLLAPDLVPPAHPVPPATSSAFEEAVLSRLKAGTADALIIGGPNLSMAAQALVHRLNHRFGAEGRTVEWISPVLARPQGDMAELVTAMHAGRVNAVFFLGCNPSYACPPDLHFPAAGRQAPLSVHLGQHLDETAALCQWHLPESHVYEQWSDALAFDGTASIIQPLISPLYDTRSAHEVLALIAGDAQRHGHELVRRSWQAHWGLMSGPDAAAGDSGNEGKSLAPFESRWRDALAQGWVPDSSPAPVRIQVSSKLAAPMPQKRPLRTGELWLDITPDHSVRHGTFAGNPWLQELPRPFTQLTWGNALHLGVRTAESMKLRTGDIVSVRTAGGARLECPVWVLPGHAEESATLHAGYGRRHAGQWGTGVGVDAHALRRHGEAGPQRITLTPTGRQHLFAVRQVHMEQDGREVARTVHEGQRAERSKPEEAPSLYPRDRYPDHAWAMVVDLDACIGCGACTVACQAENNIPTVGPEEVSRGRAMHWIRVDAYHEPDGGTAFQPVPCMHCEKAPCELVCPVGATVHDSEGLNAQVYNRCIGTRFCSNNCPYKVRRFNFLQYTDEDTEQFKAMRNPDVTVRERGVMEKCTYCVQRISRARRHALVTGEPIRDGDVVSACQASCPTRAITFGDLNDTGSAVVQARTSERHYAMLGELNTQPRTTYLARRASAWKGKA